MMAYLNVPPIQCKDIVIGGADNKVREAVMDEVNESLLVTLLCQKYNW